MSWSHYPQPSQLFTLARSFKANANGKIYYRV
ncbi:phage tailspike protein [Escherichia coli]|nr:phage tailspike protein [Escherichia coli]WCQ46833.1 phage tailspike protein [Escherichia coli]